MLTIGQCATLACLLEVAAPKPGNVHRGADFEDATLSDFLASAVAIGPAMEAAAARPLGQTVLDAVHATQHVAGSNTNLGIVLLLAPLATVSADVRLDDGLMRTLESLDGRDAQQVYDAIRLANPGGIQPVDGAVSEHDVAAAAPTDLRVAMQAAAGRDLVARQYVNGFHEVLHVVRPWLMERAEEFKLTDRIVQTHVRMMSNYPDTLIARKSGQAVALESAARAGGVLNAGSPGSEPYLRALADLDFWLRSDGKRRNPGTTADLIAAGLFALLREGELPSPF